MEDYPVLSQKSLYGLSPEHMVEKPVAFLEAKDMPFTLGEMKVLDAFLSRINARDDSCTSVVFPIKEYAAMLGLTQLKPSTMNTYLRGLMSKVVSFPNKNKNGDIIEYNNYILFHRSRCYKDEDTGKWMVELNCTDDAKKMFFHLTGFRYVHYALKNIIFLSSNSHMHLYFYLKNNIFQKEWTVSVEDVKKYMRIDAESKTYKDFRYFNKLVLSKAVEEINQKTDIYVTYERIRTNGAKIGKIRFRIQKQEVQMSFNDYVFEQMANTEKQKKIVDVRETPITEEDELADMLSTACSDEFTEKEMIEIADLVRKAIPEVSLEGRYPRGVDCARYEYLQRVFHKLDAQSEKTNIRDRFAYLKTMIKADCP